MENVINLIMIKGKQFQDNPLFSLAFAVEWLVDDNSCKGIQKVDINDNIISSNIVLIGVD